MSDPYPKEKQLARGERRYRRKVASRKTWEKLRDEKLGPCRCEQAPENADFCDGALELHHLVSRTHRGDDVADNLVPLCRRHHTIVTLRSSGAAGLVLLSRLTDAEYA